MRAKNVVLWAVGALAALAIDAGSAKADEIFFGSFPTPAGCAAQVAGDEGVVCPNNLTFNGGTAGTLTATGLNTGNPNTATPSFLTFKGPPLALDEQGLGENDTGPGTPCNTTECEINRASSVAITASVPLSQIDVIVSSVQALEGFNVWAGSAIGSLTEIASGLDNSNCTLFPGQADVCVFSLATPETTIAIQSNNLLLPAADVLLAAVSTASVPEPASLVLLGSALVGLGVMRRRRR